MMTVAISGCAVFILWLEPPSYQFIPAAKHQDTCGLVLRLCLWLIHVNHLVVSVGCFTLQSQIPNCLPPPRDSQSTGWRPRRNDRVSSPLGDAPTVGQNAPDQWICFSGPGVPYRLSHRRGLISGHGRKPHGKRQRDRRRFCPSCVHESKPDNCPGGELRTDWLQCHRRPIPQRSVVQLSWRPPGHQWWDRVQLL